MGHPASLGDGLLGEPTGVDNNFITHREFMRFVRGVEGLSANIQAIIGQGVNSNSNVQFGTNGWSFQSGARVVQKIKIKSPLA